MRTQESVVRLQKSPIVPGEKKKKSALKVLTDIVFYLICLGLIAGSILFAVSANPQKSLFGYRIYSVLTDSMTPHSQSLPGGFSKGDLIVVKIVAPNEVKVGDIVTYVPGRDSSAYLTHRVVDIQENVDGQAGLTFVTRGDTNNTDDPPFRSERLIGKKVLAIPKMGGVLQLIQDNLIVVVAVIIAGILVFSALRLKKTKKADS